MHIFGYVGSKFCVKFERAPLTFPTNFLTHTPQNMHFTVFYFCRWFMISLNCDVISLSETCPMCVIALHCGLVPTTSTTSVVASNHNTDRCGGSKSLTLVIIRAEIIDVMKGQIHNTMSTIVRQVGMWIALSKQTVHNLNMTLPWIKI